jgi:hypothetical protein
MVDDVEQVSFSARQLYQVVAYVEDPARINHCGAEDLMIHGANLLK